MPKKNYTDITFLLDRSGSMGSIRNAVINGFNEFVREQRLSEGECRITRYQFDDQFEKEIEDVSIHDNKVLLTNDSFVPRGWTALRDSFYKAMKLTGERLRKMKESERPDKVTFVVYTDGGENASKEISQQVLFDFVRDQENKYSWEFIFLGANQDSWLNASSIGISNLNAVQNFTASEKGVLESFSNLSKAYTSYRSSEVKNERFSFVNK